MKSNAAVLALVVLFGVGSASAAERLPQVLATSRTDAAVVLSADIERVETTDQLPLYRVTVNLARGVTARGLLIQYEVRSATGEALGGGSFTVRQQMLTADGERIEFLSGFSGLALGAGNTIVLRLAQTPATQVVDTCTTYCEKCAEQAKALCEGGYVRTYNCSCSGEDRTCNFTCANGRPPV